MAGLPSFDTPKTLNTLIQELLPKIFSYIFNDTEKEKKHLLKTLCDDTNRNLATGIDVLRVLLNIPITKTELSEKTAFAYYFLVFKAVPIKEKIKALRSLLEEVNKQNIRVLAPEEIEKEFNEYGVTREASSTLRILLNIHDYRAGTGATESKSDSPSPISRTSSTEALAGTPPAKPMSDDAQIADLIETIRIHQFELLQLIRKIANIRPESPVNVEEWQKAKEEIRKWTLTQHTKDKNYQAIIKNFIAPFRGQPLTKDPLSEFLSAVEQVANYQYEGDAKSGVILQVNYVLDALNLGEKALNQLGLVPVEEENEDLKLLLSGMIQEFAMGDKAGQKLLDEKLKSLRNASELRPILVFNAFYEVSSVRKAASSSSEIYKSRLYDIICYRPSAMTQTQLNEILKSEISRFENNGQTQVKAAYDLYKLPSKFARALFDDLVKTIRSGSVMTELQEAEKLAASGSTLTALQLKEWYKTNLEKFAKFKKSDPVSARFYLNTFYIFTGQSIANIDDVNMVTTDFYGRSLLMLALQQNNLAAISELLAMGADPNMTDSLGNNALHFANSTDALKLLLNCDRLKFEAVDQKNNQGITPLEAALTKATESNKNVYKENARYLIAAGANLFSIMKLPTVGSKLHDELTKEIADNSPTPATASQNILERAASEYVEQRQPGLKTMVGTSMAIVGATLAAGLATAGLAAVPVLIGGVAAAIGAHNRWSNLPESDKAALKLASFLSQASQDRYHTKMSKTAFENFVDTLVNSSDRWANTKASYRPVSINVLLARAYAKAAGTYNDTDPNNPYYHRQFGPKHAPYLKQALLTGKWPGSPDEYNPGLEAGYLAGINVWEDETGSPFFDSDSATELLTQYRSAVAMSTSSSKSSGASEPLPNAAQVFHQAIYPLNAEGKFLRNGDLFSPTNRSAQEAFMAALVLNAEKALTYLFNYRLSEEEIKECLRLRTKDDRTPLMIAVRTDNWKIVELLIQYGADPLEKNKDGNTAFHFVTSPRVARVLLAHVPSFEVLTQKNKAGFSPAECAQEAASGTSENPTVALLSPVYSSHGAAYKNHPIRTFQEKLQKAMSLYKDKTSASYLVAEELNQYLNKVLSGNTDDGLDEIQFEGLLEKVAHLAAQTGKDFRKKNPEAFASPESLCMLLLKEYGYELPESRLTQVLPFVKRYRLTLSQLQEVLIALMYGPEEYAKKQREADVEAGSSGTPEYKADSSSASDSQALLDDHIQTTLGISSKRPGEERKPCSALLSDQEIDQLLAGFSKHLWSGDKQTDATMDGVVLNALLRNDLLDNPIRTPQQKRDLADFIINQCQDYLKGSKPATMSRDDRKDLCKAIGTEGKITSGKLKEILSQFSTLHPSFDKEFNGQPERNKAMEKNRNTVVKNLLSFRKDCTDAEAMMIRFNHFLNLYPQNRLGSLPGWFYMGAVFRPASDGKPHYARVGKEALEAYEADKSEANLQACQKALYAYVGTLKGPSLIGPINDQLMQALNALDDAWQSRRPAILKALRGEEAMVGPLYHTHPKSSHPELAALQTQIDQLVRLQDMIFTLVYENPHHLDPKKNSHITPQLQACLEMIRGPQIRFNTDPPYHGLNLNHLETVQLATLLLNNIPAPEADQKAQGAPEAKAEDAVSEVSLHEPARPAASFTPAQLTELSLVIQELVANNHNEAGLKSLRDRILVLQQGDHTQPQDIVTCFLGTARERLSKTREANFPEAQKAAGASASEHEPTEQLGAAKRSGMEKFSTAMSALTRSKNTQAVYEAAVALMDSPSPENIKGIKKAIDAYIADKARVETWRKRIQESKSETAKEILLPEIDRAIQNGTVLSEIVHRDEAIRSGQKLTAIQLQRFIASAKNKEHAYTGLDQIVIAIAAGNRKEIQAAWDKTAKALEEGPVAGTYHAAESGMPAQKDVSDLLTVMLNKNSHSLLMLATQQGNHDAIKFLIEKSNAHPGTTNGISTLEALLKGDGKTSVFHCVHDVKTFKTLLKQAPASMVYHLINQARSLDGYTPLELAIQNNNVELVTALLRAGADPHQISKVEGRKGQSIWESLRDSLTPPVVDQMSLAASRPDLTNPAGRPTPHPATTATIATVVFSGSATPERETIELPELATALRKALYDYADALQGRRDWLPGSRTVEERLKAQESVQIGLKLLGQLSYLDEKSHEAVTKPYEAFLVAEAIKALDAASGKSGLRADSLIVLLWKRVKEIQTGTAMPTTFPNESIGVSEHDKRKMRAVLKDILTVIGAYTPELEKTAPGASAETTSGSSDASDGGLNSAHDPKFGPQNDL